MAGFQLDPAIRRVMVGTRQVVLGSIEFRLLRDAPVFFLGTQGSCSSTAIPRCSI